MSAQVQSLDFTCEEQSGFKYLLRATETASIFGTDLRGYLCIELHRVSAYKYYYYMGTEISLTNNDNIYARADVFNVTMSMACNRAEPFDDKAFIVLVKNGSVEAGNAEATCPTPFLAKYSNVTISNVAGSTTCTDSTFDACSDKAVLNYTHAACTTGLRFSSGGALTCLYSITVSNYTFLSTWNNDVTVDGTSTYRFICYVISQTGDVSYATEYPNYCSDTSQTSISVTSPGVLLTYSSRTETCVATSEAPDYLTYIIIVVVASVVFILAIIALILCIVFRHKVKAICKRCCRCHRRKQRSSSGTSHTGLTPLDPKRTDWWLMMIRSNMIKPVGRLELLYQKEHSITSSKSRRSSLSSIASFGSVCNLKFKN